MVKKIFCKNYAENEAEITVLNLFLFFKKFYLSYNQVPCSLVTIYFDSNQFGKEQKENV